MWKIILTVFMIGVLIGGFVCFIYFSWLFVKTMAEIDSSDYCEHSNYRYTEDHPDKVWTCNKCGEKF